ncbi:MAG: TetR/AcrR family transcriptional regulator [Bacteroidia bacterium]
MAGRPKIFDEQIALEKAANLFWKKGFEATSMDDLLPAMGVQKGSFYHSFGSKKELYVRAIDWHENNGFEAFRKMVKNQKQPIELIKSIFLSLADCAPEDHRKGCFLGNTIAELSNIDENLVENAAKHLKTLENIFYEQIKASQKSGELKTKIEPELLALYLLNLWNGINITRRVYPSKKGLKSLIEFQLQILE